MLIRPYSKLSQRGRGFLKLRESLCAESECLRAEREILRETVQNEQESLQAEKESFQESPNQEGESLG